MDWPDSWFNVPMAKVPLNWAMVWTVATLWLFVFHAVMTLWGNATGKGQTAFAPGLISTPNPTASFEVPAAASAANIGSFAPTNGSPLSTTYGAVGGDMEARYPEDGWTGSY